MKYIFSKFWQVQLSQFHLEFYYSTGFPGPLLNKIQAIILQGQDICDLQVPIRGGGYDNYVHLENLFAFRH